MLILSFKQLRNLTEISEATHIQEVKHMCKSLQDYLNLYFIDYIIGHHIFLLIFASLSLTFAE